MHKQKGVRKETHMSKYYCNIGLEVHVRLNTKSKLFCRCHNGMADANENICPYCLGYPGALPVLNKAAIEKGLLLAHNIGAEISDVIAFDRKNYFYPDLPKGYQITQYFQPLSQGGFVETEYGIVEIERIHIEEDAAKMKHLEDYSLVDYNRSGTPLVEIVTKPVIKSPEEAAQVYKYIRLLALYLNISHGVMQDGDLRCDANISISRYPELPPYKVEIKNINSFKFLEKALEYEIERQSGLLDEGLEIRSETRTINENDGKTYTIRNNESKENYRYMKEPDIFPFETPVVNLYKVETPLLKHTGYINLGLEKNAAEFLRDNPAEANVFDELKSKLPKTKGNTLFNILSLSIYIEDKIAEVNDAILEVLKLFEAEKISQQATVKLLLMSKEYTNFKPLVYAEENKLLYNNDIEYIGFCIRNVLKDNPEIAEEIRSGNRRRMGRLTGIIAGKYSNINPKYISQNLKNILG